MPKQLLRIGRFTLWLQRVEFALGLVINWEWEYVVFLCFELDWSRD